jgi:MFS superfamily sulfate permease-like transporter
VLFAIPAIVFIVLSLLPLNYPLLPDRAIAIICFGIGIVIILKQLPHAFDYTSIETDFMSSSEELSFLAKSKMSNWIQLILALLIPTIALIGQRIKKGHIALIIAVFATLVIGYLLGYNTSSIEISNLSFTFPFQLSWTFSADLLIESIITGITLTTVMLMGFWGDYSVLNYNEKDADVSLKKPLQIVGVGNLLSGFFGILPTNVSLTDSYIIRSFGGRKWISKVPIIIILLVIAVIGIPDFKVPFFVFSGILIYIGILLLIKSFSILKKSHWIDCMFIVAIGLVFVLMDYTTGFVIAMIYAFIYKLIEIRNDRVNISKAED